MLKQTSRMGGHVAMSPSPGTVNEVMRKKILLALGALSSVAAVLAAAITFNASGVAGEFDYKAMQKQITHCVELEITPEQAAQNPGAPAEMNAYWLRLDCAYLTVPMPESLEQVRMLLDTVESAARENRNARSACHDIVHEIGTKTWRSLGEESLQVGLDSCGYGYYHGVMRESILKEADRQRGVDRLRGLCDAQSAEYSLDDSEFRTTLSFCAHGVGHALGGAKVPIDEGIDLCQQMKSEIDNEGDITCVSGLLNELSQGGWGYKIEQTSVALERCRDVADRYKPICSSYSNYYANIPVETLQRECNELDPAYVVGCWEAVGLSASHERLFTGGDSLGTRLVKEPAKMAAYIEDLCAADAGTSCFTRFLAELSELTLDPPLLLQMCAKLVDTNLANRCSTQINNVGRFHSIEE
jgi:hypothetical protein